MHARCQLRPSLDQCGGGNASQFTWLDLVQAAPVDTALAAQLVASDLTEKLEYVAAAFRVLAQHGGQALLRVEHEVQVGPDRARTVPNEAEGSPVVGAAAHVRA